MCMSDLDVLPGWFITLLCMYNKNESTPIACRNMSDYENIYFGIVVLKVMCYMLQTGVSYMNFVDK